MAGCYSEAHREILRNNGKLYGGKGGATRKANAFARRHRMGVHIDDQALADVSDIAESWKCSKPAVIYWIVKSYLSEARGEALVMGGDKASDRLSLRLLSLFPE